MKSQSVAAFGLSLALLGGASGVSAQQPPFLPPGYALKTNFPKVLNASGHPTNEPVWADLGLTGGRKSIIVGTSAKELYVVNFDGSVAPGWPQSLPGQVVSSAAVGKFGIDGFPDIVVGFGGGAWPPVDAANVGGVWAFSRTGAVLWKVAGFDEPNLTPPNQFPLGVISAPAIGDIDGDGHLDVVWGSLDGHIYAVDGRTGNPKPGFPLFVRDTISSSAALYDLDGDGKLEIIIGTDTHADLTANPPPVPPTIAGGRLHVLNYFGKEVPGFPKDVDEVINSSPVVGDIDGDGRPEIIHGTGTFYSITGGAASSKKLYAWKCDGTPVPGWPVTTTGRITGSPALADLDGDGKLDVIVSEYNNSTPAQYVVAAYKGTGVRMWETTPLSYSGFNLGVGHPVVADVLGDSKLEVLVSTNSEICILSNTGVQLTAKAPGGGPSLYMPASASSAALDVDNGVLNIAAASQDVFQGTNVAVYAWTITGKTTPPVWSAFRFDSRRFGVAPNAGMCAPRTVVSARLHTLKPCRLIDTRVGSGPLGGPALVAQALRNFPIAGVCGVPTGAVAVSANITVTNTGGQGDLTVFPSDVPQPNSSAISFRAFRTRANNAMVYLSGTTTTFSVFNNSGAPLDFVLDVNGYFQ